MEENVHLLFAQKAISYKLKTKKSFGDGGCTGPCEILQDPVETYGIL